MFNSIATALTSGSANLLQPAVLFFLLGAVAALARSDLALPRDASKALSLFLMLCIGFRGGTEARAHGLDADFATAAALGLGLSLLLPFPAYALLRRAGADRLTAAATAAHYGSVSVVTFAAAQTYLAARGAEPDGFMSAVLAIMETPAILVALWIASRSGKANRPAKSDTLREVFFNGASVLLIGSFLIGLVTGEAGEARLHVFIGPVFQGALCFFLLDLGVTAAGRWKEAGRIPPAILALGVVLPLLGATVGAVLATLAGLSPGNAAALTVLAASSSYIAAPAAMRLALPQADAGTYLTLSLGETFPFNLMVGIPLYHAATTALAKMI